jgi:two-component system LytT family response regulator
VQDQLGTFGARTGAPASAADYVTRLEWREGVRVVSVDLDDIDWIGAAGNYVEIHTARRTHLVRHTVKAMQAKLDPCRFVRVRPSAIVNAARVAAVLGRPGGDYVVVLRDGTRIPSSRAFREQVRVRLRRGA